MVPSWSSRDASTTRSLSASCLGLTGRFWSQGSSSFPRQGNIPMVGPGSSFPSNQDSRWRSTNHKVSHFKSTLHPIILILNFQARLWNMWDCGWGRSPSPTASSTLRCPELATQEASSLPWWQTRLGLQRKWRTQSSQRCWSNRERFLIHYFENVHFGFLRKKIICVKIL